MKKTKIYFGLIASLFLGGYLFSSVTNNIAEARDPIKVVKLTYCKVNGEIIGYSNNCVSGPGACIDYDCYGNPVQ